MLGQLIDFIAGSFMIVALAVLIVAPLLFIFFKIRNRRLSNNIPIEVKREVEENYRREQQRIEDIKREYGEFESRVLSERVREKGISKSSRDELSGISKDGKAKSSVKLHRPTAI